MVVDSHTACALLRSSIDDEGYGRVELIGVWGLHGSIALGDDPVGENVGAGSEIFGDMETDGVKGVGFVRP